MHLGDFDTFSFFDSLTGCLAYSVADTRCNAWEGLSKGNVRLFLSAKKIANEQCAAG